MSLELTERWRRPPLLDAGWLFLLPGLAILGASVLIPAKEDLDRAAYQLEQAKLVEQHRQDRIQKYVEYLESVREPDEETVRSLAAMQLNRGSEGVQVLVPSEGDAASEASVFPALEPSALTLTDRQVERSRLEQWCLDSTTRLWMIAGGAVCVLIGLMPASRGRAESRAEAR